jgi:hypothetical protein
MVSNIITLDSLQNATSIFEDGGNESTKVIDIFVSQ